MTRPRLSYVLASYTRDAYARVDDDLRMLRSLGFRIVTFVPTYYVTECENGSLRLDSPKTPSLADQRQAFRTALELGFSLRVTPHIDMRGKWRGLVAINPLASFESSDLTYASAILHPTLQAIEAACAESDKSLHSDSPRVILTLGSELEKSVSRFSEKWCEVLAMAQSQRRTLEHCRQVEFCHNLNWDHRWRVRSNAARDAYVSMLDRVSFSYYPPVIRFSLHTADCHSVEALALDRRKAYERCTKWVCRLNDTIDLGEIGLGSAEFLRPYHYSENAFDGPEGHAARQMRRLYWAAILEFLSACGKHKMSIAGPRHATIWSVGVYNILGTHGHAEKRDWLIAEMIKKYNQSD